MIVTGTRDPGRTQSIRVLRIDPTGSVRTGWGQNGAYDIAGAPADALPPSAAGVDPASVVSKLIYHEAVYVKAQPNGAVDVGIESVDPSADNDGFDFQWIRRISPAGTTDSAFGTNGSAFVEEIGYPEDGSEFDARMSQLLPFNGDGTLSMTFIDFHGRPRVQAKVIGSAGQAQTLKLGRIKFHEGFFTASFTAPDADSVIGCGTVESTRAPWRLNSYLFKVKLPPRQ